MLVCPTSGVDGDPKQESRPRRGRAGVRGRAGFDDAYAGLSDMWHGRRPEAEGQTRRSGLWEARQSEGERRMPKGSENADAGLSDMWHALRPEAEGQTRS